VLRRVLPAVLVFAALLCDVAGGHGIALAFLLVAIPAAFALALDCYGDVLESRCSGFRPILAGLAVFLLVLSAALRSPAVVGGVPQFAVSALAFVLCLYAVVAVGTLVPARAPRRARLRRLDSREAGSTRRRRAA
jgi:hypothetical protein